mmetsp:Transcript_18750/g.34838  ORF Transcript_18750/g.34838 Transcript_18750/m.34838 type:complete len:203 (-) Transcript_18750:1234-1842(-)
MTSRRGEQRHDLLGQPATLPVGFLVHREEEGIPLSHLLGRVPFRGRRRRRPIGGIQHVRRLLELEPQTAHHRTEGGSVRATRSRIGPDAHARQTPRRIEGRAPSLLRQFAVQPDLSVAHADEILDVLQRQALDVLGRGRSRNWNLNLGEVGGSEWHVGLDEHGDSILDLFGHGVEVRRFEDEFIFFGIFVRLRIGGVGKRRE